jgi:hypothetical protein
MRRVLALGLALALGACVAPHQHAYDDALTACAQGRGSCDTARQLGRIVEQEKAEQAATAAAVASGLLAVSAGIAAGYAASQPHYVAAPVYVYCPYGC